MPDGLSRASHDAESTSAGASTGTSVEEEAAAADGAAAAAAVLLDAASAEKHRSRSRVLRRKFAPVLLPLRGAAALPRRVSEARVRRRQSFSSVSREVVRAELRPHLFF